jgi:YVTN family beta-propeller protein
VSVIDGASNTVVANVAVGTYPDGIDVNPNSNRIYVANRNDIVSVIDGTSNTVVATVATGSWPNGAAVNPNASRIYVTNTVVASASQRRQRPPYGQPQTLINGNTVSVIEDPAGPVGTTPEAPDIESVPAAGSSGPRPTTVAAAAIGAALLLAAGGWYARRRWRW